MPRATALITTAVVVVAISLLLTARSPTASARAEPSYATALARELTGLQEALAAARDSTDNRIARAVHLLEWFEGTADGGSAELVRALGGMTGTDSVPAGLITVADFAATGRLTAIVDAELRARLLDLHRRLGTSTPERAPELESYQMRLEELLSPGMWRFVFFGESGQHPLDFRASLRELHAANFDRTLRTVIRGLRERRDELVALEQEVAALVVTLHATEDAARP